jgi:transposase
LSGPASAGVVAQKKATLASQADPQERAAFREEQKTLVKEDLIFLDEFGLNLAMTRTYARAPLGERVKVTEPFHHGPNISVISAMGMHGVCAPLMLEGAVNSEVFTLYVQHLLVPCLRPGNIVLLDNVKFHYTPKAIELIEAAGARVLHLPAYSPDFNPIEGCIAKLKTALRSFKARTRRKLTNALAKALALVTEEDIRGWFAHCGYVFSFN